MEAAPISIDPENGTPENKFTRCEKYLIWLLAVFAMFGVVGVSTAVPIIFTNILIQEEVSSIYVSLFYIFTGVIFLISFVLGMMLENLQNALK